MTLRTGGAIVLLLVVAAILVGFLLVARRGRAQNFLDPKEPVFTGTEKERTAPLAWTPRKDGRISVVSFNVHFGYRTEDFVPTLRANGMDAADVFLLQESNERTAREVAAALGAAYVYYPATVHPTSNDLFGVAVLSRWPIVAHRKILLSDRSWFDAARKVAMAAVIDLGGARVEVINVHLQSGMLARGYRAQLLQVLNCAIRNACEGDPDPKPLPAAGAVLIGGDLNTWNDGLARVLNTVMSGASLRRVGGIEGTFSKDPTETTPKNTFDYFFASPHIVGGHGRVGTVRTGSDHWPIEASFQIR